MIDTLICGDAKYCMETMENEYFDCVIADPPYGIDYQSAWRTDKTAWKPKIENDTKPYLEWLPQAFRVTKTGGVLVCFCRWDVEEIFKEAINESGFVVKSQIIWDKVSHGMGDLNGSFAPQHENAWFAVKGNFHFWNERPKSVIRSNRVPAEKMIHPNEKPVGLYNKIILPLLKPNGIILDPFSGSGASLVSAKQLGRHFIGIEISEEYCAIARKRVAGANVPLPLFT